MVLKNAVNFSQFCSVVMRRQLPGLYLKYARILKYYVKNIVSIINSKFIVLIKKKKEKITVIWLKNNKRNRK